MQDAAVSSDARLKIPVLPLRDVVVYPHMVLPLFVGRARSIMALERAMADDRQILLVAQRNPTEEEPTADDLFTVGALSKLLQLLKLPDGTVKVLVEGVSRVHLQDFELEEGEQGLLVACPGPFEEVSLPFKDVELLIRSIVNQFEQYVKLSKKVPAEVLTAVSSIEDAGRLIDTIAAHMALKLEDKQKILEISALVDRAEFVLNSLETEIDLLQVEKRIRGRVKKQMEKSQREYYLNEQLKAIQKELGDLDEVGGEFELLEKKVAESGMSAEALKKAKGELTKLKMMSPMSAEATVVRGYLDWLVGMPWKKKSKVKYDLSRAKEILEAQHYGLDEVKDRIIEYLAVQSRVKKLQGPVLCLVGPPGVGKTSLGRSIAESTNRKYVRVALGGVRDEAEIRGHRRTYIGSMPGKLMQRLSKAGVRNPLILLDEIDKLGADSRGDPASALLEVLDPEQNNSFSDHYLEVPYDLSDVMFVCTANSMNIPPALLDRMEVIRIPGYTEDEKYNIAVQHLLPKQIQANGLKEGEFELGKSGLRELIRYYTKEAGVRGLERELAKLCRKAVKEIVTNQAETLPIAPDEHSIEHYSGVRKYYFGQVGKENRVGQVTGLAWTSLGGDLLIIEASAVPGKGKFVKTGSLGDVMQESIQAAITVVRGRANLMKFDHDFYEKLDLHVHVPEGATPKDGPSAGIGMCTALVSVLTSIPVHADVAMTGEITLRGEVLPIGGLKEKLLAAHRGGIRLVIIPKENERDLKEVPENIKQDLDIRMVEWIDEVFSLALVESPARDASAQEQEVDVEELVVVQRARKNKPKGKPPHWNPH